jgi:hypothetical protein
MWFIASKTLVILYLRHNFLSNYNFEIFILYYHYFALLKHRDLKCISSVGDFYVIVCWLRFFRHQPTCNEGQWDYLLSNWRELQNKHPILRSHFKVVAGTMLPFENNITIRAIVSFITADEVLLMPTVAPFRTPIAAQFSKFLTEIQLPRIFKYCWKGRGIGSLPHFGLFGSHTLPACWVDQGSQSSQSQLELILADHLRLQIHSKVFSKSSVSMILDKGKCYAICLKWYYCG